MLIPIVLITKQTPKHSLLYGSIQQYVDIQTTKHQVLDSEIICKIVFLTTRGVNGEYKFRLEALCNQMETPV